MLKFNYADLDKFRKMAGKTKAAESVVQAVYNNNGKPVTLSKLREIDVACKLSSEYPEFFSVRRIDYSSDHVLTVISEA